MAAEYEVNIKINTGKAETQLKNIESSVAKIGKAEKQSINTTDRRVASLVKLRRIGDDIRALEKKGLDLSKAKLQVTKAGEAIDKKMFLTANSRMGVAVKELNAQRKITKELERQEKARRRQRTKRAEGVALGAASGRKGEGDDDDINEEDDDEGEDWNDDEESDPYDDYDEYDEY